MRIAPVIHHFCPLPPVLPAIRPGRLRGSFAEKRGGSRWRRLASAAVAPLVFTWSVSAWGSSAQADDASGANDGDLNLSEVVSHGDRIVDGSETAAAAPSLKSESVTQAKSLDPAAAMTAIQAEAPGETGTGGGTLAMAVRSPGITVREQGHNQPAAVSLRGSSSEQVSVLMDGISLNGLAGGGFDLSSIPSAFVQRLSVVRGAVGARYGAGALGGAIDLELIAPKKDERRVFGELAAASFGTFEGSVGTALDAGGTGILASAFAKASEGDYPYRYDMTPLVDGDGTVSKRRENNQSRRFGALVKARRSGRVDVDAFVEADGGWRGVPGAVQAPTRHARQDDLSVSSAAKVRGTAMDGSLELTGRLGGRYGRLRWSSDRREPSDWQDEHAVHGDFQARKDFESISLDAGIRGGSEGLSGPFHGTHERFAGAAFLGGEAEIGIVTLVAVLRGEMAGDSKGFIPKAGLQVVPLEGLELTANAGRSFRAPSFGELYLEQGFVSANPDLKDETATYGDVGIAFSRRGVGGTGLSLRASLTGFATRYDDVILYELYAPLRVKPYNLGGAWSWGGEGELEAALSVGGVATLRMNLSGTVARSRNEGDDERFKGNELPFHPRHRLTGRLEAEVWRLKAFAAFDAQGRQRTNRSNTTSLDGHVRADFGLSALVHRRSGLVLGLAMANAFDAQGQDVYGYPLTGRSFRATLGFDMDFTHPNSPEAPSIR